MTSGYKVWVEGGCVVELSAAVLGENLNPHLQRVLQDFHEDRETPLKEIHVQCLEVQDA